MLSLGLWKMNSPSTELSAANAPLPARAAEVPATGPGSETIVGAAPAPLSSSASPPPASAPLGAAASQIGASTAEAKPGVPASGAGATGSGAVAVGALQGASAAAKRPAGAAVKPVVVANAASRPDPAITSPGASASVAAKEPEARQETLVVAAPARPAAPVPVRQGPQEICANAGFLAKPMCVFNECEKPEFSRLAFCVANRKTLQDTSRSQQP